MTQATQGGSNPAPGLTILGNKVTTPVKALETFRKPTHVYEVTLITEEVTALCPITGQPDWYTVGIFYLPRERCIESKSLKLYLWAFREEGHFGEDFARAILEDVVAACDPHFCQVTTKMKPRGGIAIKAVAEWGSRL